LNIFFIKQTLSPHIDFQKSADQLLISGGTILYLRLEHLGFVAYSKGTSAIFKKAFWV